MSSVTYTASGVPGTTPEPITVTDEPVAPDGSWSVTLTSVTIVGFRTATVTAGGVSRTASFTVSALTFGVQMTQNRNGAISATTKPGAACIAWATLPGGGFSQAPSLYGVNTANASGNVSWTYPPEPGGGTGIQVVRCIVGAETHQASAQYTLP